VTLGIVLVASLAALSDAGGSTLILAYADRYPNRVSEIVLNGVGTTRRTEIDGLYGGVARFFPEARERFRAGVHEADRDSNLVSAYARLMNSHDPRVTARAAAHWCAWEDAVLSAEPHGPATPSATDHRGRASPSSASPRTTSRMPHGSKKVCFCATRTGSPAFPACCCMGGTISAARQTQPGIWRERGHTLG
jgi:pimeloyl-ACP methyl ester carboxylesterase